MNSEQRAMPLRQQLRDSRRTGIHQHQYIWHGLIKRGGNVDFYYNRDFVLLKEQCQISSYFMCPEVLSECWIPRKARNWPHLPDKLTKEQRTLHSSYLHHPFTIRLPDADMPHSPNQSLSCLHILSVSLLAPTNPLKGQLPAVSALKYCSVVLTPVRGRKEKGPGRKLLRNVILR